MEVRSCHFLGGGEEKKIVYIMFFVYHWREGETWLANKRSEAGKEDTHKLKLLPSFCVREGVKLILRTPFSSASLFFNKMCVF